MQNNSLVTTQHEVRGYHVYQNVWKPLVGEKLVAKREFYSPMDKYAVKVVLGN